MKYSWQYTKKATKDLLDLDQKIAQRIVKKIHSFCSSVDPMKNSKPLTGFFLGLYHFRIGDYRAIFRQEKNKDIVILLILRIKHRKDIYKK